MSLRIVLIGVALCLGFGFGTTAVCDALGVGHTTSVAVRNGCVVETTVDAWGHTTNETEVCP